jgi:hypothetical protein
VPCAIRAQNAGPPDLAAGTVDDIGAHIQRAESGITPDRGGGASFLSTRIRRGRRETTTPQRLGPPRLSADYALPAAIALAGAPAPNSATIQRSDGVGAS